MGAPRSKRAEKRSVGGSLYYTHADIGAGSEGKASSHKVSQFVRTHVCTVEKVHMLCWLGFERGGGESKRRPIRLLLLKKNATWHYKICPSHFSLLLSGGAAHRFSASLLSPVGKADFDFSPLSFRPPPQKKGKGEGKRGGLESSQWQKGGKRKRREFIPRTDERTEEEEAKAYISPPFLSLSL